MGGGHAHGGEKGSTGGMLGGSGGSTDYAAMLSGDFALALAESLSNSLDPTGLALIHTVKEGLCKNCSVLAVKMDAVFENGTRADVSSGVYLHHIFSANVAMRKVDIPMSDT
jgi:hypothetical protein